MNLVNEITTGIAQAILKEFGNDTKIYAETQKQGFKEPCFFVRCINQTHEHYFGLMDSTRRYKRENHFCIHYFPQNKENDARNEIHAVCERLEECLEWITASGDLIMGKGMRYEISDDVLLFFVDYNLFLITDTDEETNMEEMSLSSGAK